MAGIRKLAKSIVKNMPFIRNVVIQRDKYLAERNQLAEERDKYLAERSQLAEERDKYLAERSQLAEEIDKYLAERNQLAEERDRYITWAPPGHFYSPIPSIEQIKLKEKDLFGNIPESLQSIELNTKHQLDLFECLGKYYREIPFSDYKKSNLRYYYINDFYSYGDGIILHSMIRHLNPKRIIEVGSGYSSAVTLDTNENFFDNSISCTFIEPYPERLLSLIEQGSKDHIHLIEKKLEDVELSLFEELCENDILFIDSTHVSKIGSDVNYIFFEILPRLKKGVYIHFHDIFYPFEYPSEWIYEGRAWNESYILRSFLQYNNSFSIEFWNHYMFSFYREKLSTEMPLFLKNPGGAIWLRKN